MGGIREVLDKIIGKRSEKAADKERMEAELGKKEQFLEHSEKLLQSFGRLREEQQRQLCGSMEMAEKLKASGENAARCRQAYREALAAVRRLKVRYRRPTVDLTVIGETGAGKSRLLQSASGLDNDCIPALPGASCTGVSSIVENVTDLKMTEAHFLFKTEEEVAAEICHEIEGLTGRLMELKGETGMAPAVRIEGTDPEKIREAFQAVISEARALEQNRRGADQTKAGNLRRLAESRQREYAEEEVRSQWMPYVGSSQRENMSLKNLGLTPVAGADGCWHYVLSDPAQIRKYVAKHNGGGKNYYHYIAVKEAVIRTEITGIDARIRLMDTVGIGDPAADTVSRVREAVRNESDGVIFLSAGRVRNNASEGVDDEDILLLETLREMYLEHRNTGARYWMAFLHNHRDNPDAPGDRRYSTEYLKVMERSYGGSGNMLGENGILFRRVLDVSRPEEVKEILREFLAQIAEHLDSIDQRLEKEADRLCREAAVQEQKLKFLMGNIQINTPELLFDNRAYIQLKKQQETLWEELKKYRRAVIKRRDSEPEKMSFLRQRLTLVSDLRDGKTVEELHRDLGSIVDAACREGIHTKDARAAAMDQLKKTVREIASFAFVEQREMETRFKETVAELFVRAMQLDLEEIEKQGIASVSIKDKDFFGKMAALLFDGIYNGEEPKQIFESMDRFRMDEMNALTKALFNHHAEICLTGEPHREPAQSGEEESAAVSTGGDTGAAQDGGRLSSGGGQSGFFASMWKESDEGREPERGQEKETLTESFNIPLKDREKIMAELKSMLNDFILNVERDAGDEAYLVNCYDQINEEVYHFMQILEARYEARWLMAVRRLKEQGLLVRDGTEDEDLREVCHFAGQIKRFFLEGQIFL